MYCANEVYSALLDSLCGHVAVVVMWFIVAVVDPTSLDFPIFLCACQPTSAKHSVLCALVQFVGQLIRNIVSFSYCTAWNHCRLLSQHLMLISSQVQSLLNHSCLYGFW